MAVRAALTVLLLLRWTYRLFLRGIGRPCNYNFTAEKKITIPSREAEEVAERGLACLIGHGFRAGPHKPLCEGWVMSAVCEIGFDFGDPRQMKQSVEFRFERGILTITHRIKTNWMWRETGELDYQTWMVESLAAGRSLDSPPRLLCEASQIVLLGGALAVAAGILFHCLPAECRAIHLGAYSVAFLFANLITVLAMPFYVIGWRWSTGRALMVPALLLLFAGAVLYLS